MTTTLISANAKQSGASEPLINDAPDAFTGQFTLRVRSAGNPSEDLQGCHPAYVHVEGKAVLAVTVEGLDPASGTYKSIAAFPEFKAPGSAVVQISDDINHAVLRGAFPAPAEARVNAALPAAYRFAYKVKDAYGAPFVFPDDGGAFAFDVELA
jgi:hypothetical protein